MITAEQKEDLYNALKGTKSVSEYCRISVILAHHNGYSPDDCAEIFNIGKSTAYRYIAEYNNLQKTDNSPKGGRDFKLDEYQTQALDKHLKEKTYLKTKDIVEYVKSTYHVTFSVSGMTKWLQKNNFRYKRPATIPGRMAPYQQKLFQMFYDDLKINLKKDEEIYFADAVHPAHQPQAVCGWIKSNETKHLPTTAKQTRVHYFGAVSIHSEIKLVSQKVETADAKAFISFCQHLESSTDAKKIHLILDNASSHKSKEVQEYFLTSKIKPIYLPPYSPNLNVIERLWKIMRELKMYNKTYLSFKDFSSSIESFFEKATDDYLEILKMRLNDSFQVIVPNILST
ncbi:MAG: IS630 family transposase ISVa15 [Holosporales bacterium]